MSCLDICVFPSELLISSVLYHVSLFPLPFESLYHPVVLSVAMAASHYDRSYPPPSAYPNRQFRPQESHLAQQTALLSYFTQISSLPR